VIYALLAAAAGFIFIGSMFTINDNSSSYASVLSRMFLNGLAAFLAYVAGGGLP
jgi:hypothetical protein